MAWYWTTLICFGVFLLLVTVYDLFQKEHSILRNYPLVGHFRYFAEWLGVYLRAYWYSGDREEMPFNRVQRTWVYRAAKNVDTTIGFGSTRDLRPLGNHLLCRRTIPCLARR